MKEFKEAQRMKHLEPEVVFWKILGESDFLGDGSLDLDALSTEYLIEYVNGVVEAGYVLLVSSAGAWTMTIEAFDSHYKGR